MHTLAKTACNDNEIIRHTGKHAHVRVGKRAARIRERARIHNAQREGRRLIDRAAGKRPAQRVKHDV